MSLNLIQVIYQTIPPSYFEIASQSGTILAAVIALISFWWVSLRGPVIVCSPVRYMTIMRLESAAFIIPKFTLSNIGGSSGVIEHVSIALEQSTPNDGAYRFISFYDGFYEFKLPDMNRIAPLESPVLPFVIENGKAVFKEITFKSKQERPQFLAGKYILKIFILLQHKGFIKKIQKKLDQKGNEIIVLEQEFSIRNDLELGHPRKAMIIDPISDILEF